MLPNVDGSDQFESFHWTLKTAEAMFSASVCCFGATRRPRLVALSLLITLIFCHLKTAESENINCKNKVRNTWLQHCIIREKRDTGFSRFKRHIPHDDRTSVPANPSRSRFSPPMTGDDLGMGMSLADFEDLYEEMIQRMPRAPKGNKEQAIKALTDFAAKCCKENLADATCSDPTNVLSCP